MKRSLNLVTLALAIVACTLGAASATPISNTYNFYHLTNNSSVNVAIGEAQLQLIVSGDTASPSSVDFLFKNLGPSASSITDIYFHDTTPLLLNPGQLTNGSGVNFSHLASPGDLPGWPGSIKFVAPVTASYDSNSPHLQQKGVNPGEWLNIAFAIASTHDISDVIGSLDDGLLRVGIHVQGFDNGGSESFTNTTPVPEPGTLVLLGAGFLGLAILGKRRKNP